jgi:hypothetical protein
LINLKVKRTRLKMLLNIQYIIDNLIKIYLLLIESYLFAGLNWFKIIPDLIEQAPNQILDVQLRFLYNFVNKFYI